MTANGNAGVREGVFARVQTETLYRQGRVVVATNAAAALIVAVTLVGVASTAALVAWSVAMLAVCVARLGLMGAFHRHGSRLSPLGWRRAALAGAGVSGILWGVAGPWLAGHAAMEYQLLVAFVVGGLCAGAVSALVVSWYGYACYLALTLGPLAGWFMLGAGGVERAMGALVVLYALALAALARDHHRRFHELVVLDSRGAALLGRLRDGNRELVEVNRRLAAEVEERRRAEEGLRLSEGRFRDIAAVAADWFWECDATLRCTGTWGRHRDLLGVGESALVDEHLPALIAAHAVDMESAERFRIEMAAQAELDDVEVRWRRTDGAVRVLRISARPVFDGDQVFRGYRGAARDSTGEYRLARRLTYQARHDALTGLLSRRELERRLQRLIGDEAPSEHAMCYLDLDQFKVINDTCGHVAGDELLRQIAATLSARVHHRDTLARLGGDEFAVLMEHCPLVQAERVAGEMRAAIAAFRFRWEDKIFNLAVSIGVVAIDARHGQTLSDVLRAADAACYLAKEEGRNRVHVYRPDDTELTRRFGEMHWVAEISGALDEDRFELMYQTIAPLDPASATGRHFEVLVRMRSPDGQLIPPGAFLPAAERYNLAGRLDWWVVEHTLAWLEAHPDALADLHLCSINLSGQSLVDDGFMTALLGCIDSSAVPAAKLCFEITETAAIGNLASARHFVETLRARGCSVALDDFGSGLSSFGYLKDLPIDYLKIDGVFVKHMASDPIDRAMVKSINEIGHVMGKRTVAEFVEDEAILECLREIGVDHVQGYGIDRPQPLDTLSPTLSTVRALRA